MTHQNQLRIRELPHLPRPVAGQFVGTAAGSLVVAGGSWWTLPPGQGGKKMWDDKIHILHQRELCWKDAARLPRPLAYGGSASFKDRLVLAGGRDHLATSRSVWSIEIRERELQILPWPDLEVPAANHSMAYAGDRLYVLGGQESPNSPASSRLWSLTIASDGSPMGRWQEEAPLPGPGRILAAATGCGNTLYVIGGARLIESDTGAFTRQYLREAWSFEPAKGWTQIPAPPAASVAAPAVCRSDSEFLLLGGDDGQMAGVTLGLREEHPGFSRNVISYDSLRGSWTTVGELPLGLVTTGAAVWRNGRMVIPGGEDRPGSRSDVVLELDFNNQIKDR